MDLAVIEPGLLAWLAALTGVEASCVVKANAARPVHNGSLVLMSWLSSVGVGIDTTSWEYDADAATALEEMTPSVTGERRAVLQVDVEVYDQRAGYDASHVAQRVVDRARAPSSLAALAVLNLGLAGVSDARRTDYPADGRMVARATVEVSINATSLYTDTAGQTAPIESVTIGATVTGSSGSALPNSVDGGGTFDGP